MSALWGDVSEVIDLFPKVLSRPVVFGQCSVCDDKNLLTGDDLERWKIIPPGGNHENLPLKLRTSAKFSDAFRKLAMNKPSYTLPKTDGNLTTGAFFHPNETRRINQTEKTRIASFPDKYQFVGNGKDIAARIGNSVPPPLNESHCYPNPSQLMER
jgi:site-specific DNA-cytosine methylase